MTNHHLKHIISSIVVLLFTLSLFFVSPPVESIADSKVPLSGNGVTAYFFVFTNPENVSADSYNSYWLCDYAGQGLITEKTKIYNDTSKVPDYIVSAPDCEAKYGKDKYIEWNTIGYYWSYSFVVGILKQQETVEEDESAAVPEEQPEEEVTEVEEAKPEEEPEPIIEVVEGPAEEPPVEEPEVVEEEMVPETITNPVTVTLNRQQILNAKKADYSSNTVLKWDQFRIGSKDTYDGSIPINLLDDPVYTCMLLPSESRTDNMINSRLDNAHILGYLESPATKVLNIGSVYQTSGTTINSDVTICLGKMKLLAHSKSKQQWIVLDDQPYPRGIVMYQLPWGSSNVQIKPEVDYSAGYARIHLTPEQFNSHVLHFWGACQRISSDYDYYFNSFEIWCENTDCSKNSMTTTIGIDAKTEDQQRTTCQLYTSRGLTVKNYKKISMGHTIPADSYVPSYGPTIMNLIK